MPMLSLAPVFFFFSPSGSRPKSERMAEFGASPFLTPSGCPTVIAPAHLLPVECFGVFALKPALGTSACRRDLRPSPLGSVSPPRAAELLSVGRSRFRRTSEVCAFRFFFSFPGFECLPGAAFWAFSPSVQPARLLRRRSFPSLLIGVRPAAPLPFFLSLCTPPTFCLF